MREFDNWLNEFLVDKTEVPPPLEKSEHFAAYNIRRFLQGENQLWEIAITYTNRLVVRSGKIAEDHITIEWGQWQTQHDVVIPTSGARGRLNS